MNPSTTVHPRPSDRPRRYLRRLSALAALSAAGWFALAATAAPAHATPAPGSGCAAVQVITARASTEAAGEVQRCPNQKIVLVGYSQGAHVVGDVLGGGGGGTLGASTAPISATIASEVVAVVQFGDPRHVVNQSYDLGTSRRNGLFPRTSTQLQVLAQYASRIRSYCDSGDTFCDSGLNTVVHLTYLNRYQSAAAQFVLGRIGG